MPPEYFKNKLALVRLKERVIKLRDRDTDELIWSNESGRIRDTFKDEEKFEKWRICCQEAVVCCHVNAQYLPRTRNPLGQLVDDPQRADECPGTWDGLSCWPPSAAGQLAWRICPRVAYLLDFEPACRGYVTKQCFSNGSWFINRNGHEWSDYSTCSPEGVSVGRVSPGHLVECNILRVCARAPPRRAQCGPSPGRPASLDSGRMQTQSGWAR